MTQTLVAPKVKVDRKWQLWIGGKFQDGASERTLINPADGTVLCKVAEADKKQTEAAIKAARKAFDEGPWPRMTAMERAQFLFKLADKIDEYADELAELETLNGGKPLREAKYDIADAANCFRYYAGLVTKPTGQAIDVPAPSITTVVREPIGVCAQIIPWNYPFLMGAWKLAPAMAAGNCCILKPSEFTPLTAVRLAEILQELELPEGVVNIVLGDGPTVGNTLSESKLVDKVAFTGSVRTGKAVAAAALGNLKKVTLELGGKSPMVVFNDFDVDTAVDYALFAIYCNAGQVCSAGSRLLIEEPMYDKFVKKFVERAKHIKVGPGMDPETEMGPLVNETQMKRVLEYVEIGQKEGAKLETGGDQPKGDKYGKGFYINPAVFTNVKQDMRIVQEEIFGPVVVVQKFKTEEEAIKLANDSDFGLAAAVFNKALTIEPNFAQARNHLGIALYQEKHISEAIAVFRQALNVKPDYAEAFYNLGTALYRKGEVAEAEKALVEAIRFDPQNAYAYNNLGLIQMRRGNVDEAIESWRKAITIDPVLAAAFINIGRALHLSKKSE